MIIILYIYYLLLVNIGLMKMIYDDEVDLQEESEDNIYIDKIMKTLPLLGAADSETGKVVTNWKIMGGGEIYSQIQHLPQDVTPWIFSWWEHVCIGTSFGVPNIFSAWCR